MKVWIGKWLQKQLKEMEETIHWTIGCGILSGAQENN